MQHVSQALGGLSKNRIPCVILGMAHIIEDSCEDYTILSEKCIDDCWEYANQIAKSSAPLGLIEYPWKCRFDHRVGHVTPLVFGTKDTKETWDLLETHGYDPRQIFRAIPPDDRLLPHVRYAHLWLPPEQKNEEREEVEFDPKTYELPPEPQFTCIQRHLQDGLLKREERKGLIRQFQTIVHHDDDRPMLLVFQLNIFDFVKAALSSISPPPPTHTDESECEDDLKNQTPPEAEHPVLIPLANVDSTSVVESAPTENLEHARSERTPPPPPPTHTDESECEDDLKNQTPPEAEHPVLIPLANVNSTSVVESAPTENLEQERTPPPPYDATSTDWVLSSVLGKLLKIESTTMSSYRKDAKVDQEDQHGRWGVDCIGTFRRKVGGWNSVAYYVPEMSSNYLSKYTHAKT